MPNRLINETSPYLLQHANNPVDWYPWGPEALTRAQQEDRPILLSIGYSACHWCHVMERESFKNPHIASLMNELFVCIKVDREERPDLDGIYMQAVQAMTGQGGWPLTIFLTPERIPFFGGTYFPPEDRHGLPSFRRILQGISQTYQEQKPEVAEVAKRMFDALKRASQAPPSSSEPLTSELLDNGYQAAHHSFEPSFGGFGNAPKFPNPMLQEMLLRQYHRTGEPEALQMVEKTLQSMANGGIYDHLGGGFHRYSTDAKWLVPHFEKMLYDNALLSRLYLHTYQITGDNFYRQIVEETLDYILREMTNPTGGFYSTQDADSEGIEGKFYLWEYEEVMATLDLEEAQGFCQHYNISREGNFEQSNILHISQNTDRTHQNAGRQSWTQTRKKLLEIREKRVPPGKDTKVLTAWNGMMLRSLAEAAATLQRPDYLEAATRNAAFLLSSLWVNNRLLRTWKDGQSKLLGYLEDYALLINGLLSLYEATFDVRWIDAARELGDSIIELFWDPIQEIFYDTGKDHETLLVRPRELTDGATPSGGSVSIEAMLRLSLLTGNDAYRKVASTTLRSMNKILGTHPTALTYWLSALDFYLSTPKEIAIIGVPEDPATNALLQVITQRFQPNSVLAGFHASTESGQRIPLLEGRSMINGEPTVYVCENYTCKMPVTNPKDLENLLDSPTVRLL